jgi:hypothetical protein
MLMKAKSAIGFCFLVVVDEFEVPGARGAPGEADAPLVVDADALLAGAGTDQLLQAVSGARRPESFAPPAAHSAD